MRNHEINACPRQLRLTAISSGLAKGCYPDAEKGCYPDDEEVETHQRQCGEAGSDAWSRDDLGGEDARLPASRIQHILHGQFTGREREGERM